MDIQSYLTAYEDALNAAQATDQTALNQQRRTAQSRNASTANASGLLYSGVPQALNIQYDTATYYPAWAKNFQNYATTRDRITQNMLQMYNQLRYYDEATKNIQAENAALGK